MNDESSDARNSAPLAISIGSPNRPNFVLLALLLLISNRARREAAAPTGGIVPTLGGS